MYTVIIVDDEKFVRKGLIKMLDWESSGFQVIDEAEDGEDALILLREKKPDLVLTDIRMPVLDGLELIHAAFEEKMETEFIIISGYNDFRYARQAMRYGVLDYVLKPVDQAEIKQALEKIFVLGRWRRNNRKNTAY
ncbi:response regulator [Paenibacillus sp. LHD-117]|nr:response regulator [Paenibacillus sp. LHD-117]MDQ6417852.1 response regulator [Paenibacillus sp. LHD-117]